jgi:hypothetical protein
MMLMTCGRFAGFVCTMWLPNNFNYLVSEEFRQHVAVRFDEIVRRNAEIA